MIPYLKIGLVTAILLIVSHCAAAKKVPVRESPREKWEEITFQFVNEAIQKASGIEPLEQTPLSVDETEIRVWRVGLVPLEAAIFRRSGDSWSAVHLMQKDMSNPSDVDVNALPAPKYGWEQFWADLDNLGLFRMPPADQNKCYGKQLDGVGITVEISSKGRYRTYMYPLFLPGCKNSLEMDIISEYIGEQFDDGSTDCKRAEWFPCAKVLKERRLSEGSQIR